MYHQVNHANSGPELLHGKWSSLGKYNSFVNPFTSCETGIIIHYNAYIHYNVGSTVLCDLCQRVE